MESVITYLVDDSDEHLKYNEIGEEKPATQKNCCNYVLLVLWFCTHLYFTDKHIASKAKAWKGRTVSYTISVQFSDEKICMILSGRKSKIEESVTHLVHPQERIICLRERDCFSSLQITTKQLQSLFDDQLYAPLHLQNESTYHESTQKVH